MLERIRPSMLASVVAAALALHPMPASPVPVDRIAGGGAASPASGVPWERQHAEQYIIEALRSRALDPQVLDRMREKLSALDPVDVQLAASLCDRIASSGQSAGAEIAFSIVTALIVLS